MYSDGDKIAKMFANWNAKIFHMM